VMVTPSTLRIKAIRVANNYLANAGYALEVARLVDPSAGVEVKLPPDRRQRRTLKGDDNDGIETKG
jgi:hypothetical protein